jgi:hypothetical protein
MIVTSKGKSESLPVNAEREGGDITVKPHISGPLFYGNLVNRTSRQSNEFPPFKMTPSLRTTVTVSERHFARTVRIRPTGSGV